MQCSLLGDDSRSDYDVTNIQIRSAMSLLTERYVDKISNALSFYDRILIQGTLPGLCYAKGMTNYLNFNHIRVFDYPRWADPLREHIRENSERLATQNSIKIGFLRSHQTRKEEVVEKVLKRRGLQPGLVHILSAMGVLSGAGID